LVLDDAQWSDQDTLEWLHFLLHFKSSARLMLVCTVRSEEVGEAHPLRHFMEQLQREHDLSEVELSPLNATETTALASQVAGRTPPSDVLAHLYRQTEGNPLFVVETMRIQVDHTRGEGDREPIPSSIQAVIARRLSQLTYEARETIQIAAVIGREFTLEVLTVASGKPQDVLVNGLDELLHRRIIREHAGPPGWHAYDFSHDRIREVTYRSLSAARRSLLHRNVAQAVEQVFAANLDAVSGQVAAHYEQARAPAQAIRFYERAAQAARKVYANADAIRHFQHAQTQITDLADQSSDLASFIPTINEAMGDLLHHVTRYDDAIAAYRRALTGPSPLIRLDRARLQRKIGNTLRDQGGFPAAEEVYRLAEACLPDPAAVDATPEEHQEWIQIQIDVNSLYYWLGRVTESDRLLRRLQPIVQEHGTPVQRAELYRSLGFRLFRQNRSVATDEMVSYARAAADIFAEIGDHTHIPAATFGLGFIMLWNGRPEEAEPYIAEGLRLAERTGDTSLIARCTTYLTVAYRQLGRVDLVRRYVERSLQAAEVAGMPEYTAIADANASWLDWHDGHWPGVREHGLAAVALWTELPSGHASVPFQWLALCPLIAAACATDDVAAAIGFARVLLDPSLQQLPEAFAVHLAAAVDAADAAQFEAARAALGLALDLAPRLRLL
jgi:tetratricopeptide (TPR) repeat protein